MSYNKLVAEKLKSKKLRAQIKELKEYIKALEQEYNELSDDVEELQRRQYDPSDL